MRTYTVDDVIRVRGCCYRRDKVAWLWAGSAALSWQDILRLGIPLTDLVWFGTHAVLVTDKQHMAFNLECSRVCLRLVRHVDSRVLAALVVAERFHVGEATDAELEQAHESLAIVPAGVDGVNEFTCAVVRTTSRLELSLLGGDNSWVVSKQAVAIQRYGAADIERRRQLAHITALTQEETE